MGRARREPDLRLRPQQQNVGQGGLDRIAHAPGPVRTRPVFRLRVGTLRPGIRAPSQFAQVRRIHRQVAREGTAQGLVGGDQGAQAFVDLAVFPLPALLYPLHDKQADADGKRIDPGRAVWDLYDRGDHAAIEARCREEVEDALAIYRAMCEAKHRNDAGLKRLKQLRRRMAPVAS